MTTTSAEKPMRRRCPLDTPLSLAPNIYICAIYIYMYTPLPLTVYVRIYIYSVDGHKSTEVLICATSFPRTRSLAL